MSLLNKLGLYTKLEIQYAFDSGVVDGKREATKYFEDLAVSDRKNYYDKGYNAHKKEIAHSLKRDKMAEVPQWLIEKANKDDLKSLVSKKMKENPVRSEDIKSTLRTGGKDYVVNSGGNIVPKPKRTYTKRKTK